MSSRKYYLCVFAPLREISENRLSKVPNSVPEELQPVPLVELWPPRPLRVLRPIDESFRVGHQPEDAA